VGAGEIRGLVGANGAGKSTFVSCVSGALEPDAGTVELSYAGSRGAGAALGVIGQRTAVYRSLSVEANIRFFARLVDPRDRAVSAKVDEIIDSLCLESLRGRPVGALSLGQQRLVHIASALVRRPPIAVLDEPTAGLDLAARSGLFRLLEELADDGTAVLLSTHHLDEVEDHCDTVTVLHGGRTIADGSVDEVIREYGDGEDDGHPEIQEMVKRKRSWSSARDLADAFADDQIAHGRLDVAFARLTSHHVDSAGELR
jgi:ABC-2 type transport system ATP-binding protein